MPGILINENDANMRPRSPRTNLEERTKDGIPVIDTGKNDEEEEHDDVQAELSVGSVTIDSEHGAAMGASSAVLSKRSRVDDDDANSLHPSETRNEKKRRCELDPDEWKLRTIHAKLKSPLGLCINQRIEITGIKLNSQADELGIKVGSVLVSLNGQEVNPDDLKTQADGIQQHVLVVAEPRRMNISVVRDASEEWLRSMDYAEIKEACRQLALYVLTEYDRWIATESVYASISNSVVDDVQALMFQKICSEIAYPYDNNDDNKSFGIPDWMVFDTRFRLIGPQPWMVTRRLALQCVWEIYNQTHLHGQRWEVVKDRSEWLTNTYKKKIRGHLKTVGLVPSSKFVKATWRAFLNDHAASCSWYRLTQYYVVAAYDRWKASGAEKNSKSLRGVNYWSRRPCLMSSLLEIEFRSHMENLRFTKFPLAEDNWDRVFWQAWKTFCSRFSQEPKSISQSDVLDLLEDMEEEMGFLTISNQALCVKIKRSSFLQEVPELSPPLQQQQQQQQPHLITESDSVNTHPMCRDDQSLSSESRIADCTFWSTINAKDIINRDTSFDNLNALSAVDNGAQVNENVDKTLADRVVGRKSNRKVGDKKNNRGSSSAQSKNDSDDELDLTDVEVPPDRQQPLPVQTRVYCRWPEDDLWYWGQIAGITPNKTHGFKYQVQFDDGDFLDKVPDKDICSGEEYRKLAIFYHQKDKKVSRTDKLKKPQDTGALLSLRELFLARCNKCSLCQRKACGKCFSCLRKSEPQEICVQTMCCEIPLSRKSQLAPMLGDGYRFAFVEPNRESECKRQSRSNWKGLLIVSPSGNQIRNVEKYLQTNVTNENKHSFYAHIGWGESLADKSSSLGRLTPCELYIRRCKSCLNCVKEDCKRCSSCLANADASNVEERCCLQKMCCLIARERKAQPAIGLPEGWTFVFDLTEDNLYPEYNGLYILDPEGLKISHVEKAIVEFSSALAIDPMQFYSHVGLLVCPKNVLKSDHEQLATVAVENRDSPETTLVLNNDNSQVLNDDDGEQVLNDDDGEQFGELVLNDDDGEQVLNDDDDQVLSDDDEQVLTNDNDEVLNNIFSSIEETTPILPPELPAAKTAAPNIGKFDSDEPLGPRGGESSRDEATASLCPKDLAKLACGTCSMCQKKDCGLCVTCVNNQSRTRRFKEVCFRKMCQSIPLQKKAQGAPGFPLGWKFAFCDPSCLPARRSQEETVNTELQGLCVFRKPNFLHRSVASALRHCKYDTGEEEECACIFYKYIGLSCWRGDDHFLLGKGYCRQWTDMMGRPRIIHGYFSKYETNIIDTGHQQFTVTYNQSGRCSSLEINNGCNLRVPESEVISFHWAWGGYYEDQAKARKKEVLSQPMLPCSSWSIPDQRHESLVLNENGILTPHLTLIVRRFQLVFFVGPSTIPNAGNGVFVTCTCLAPPGEKLQHNFELEPGQYLDLGVYAPFRAEDRKGVHILILKNFIHSLHCEEWNFDTFDDDFQFDITDDVTGYLHEMAKKHIPAYVNECCVGQAPSVHAWHDPEGCVHYLLGHDHDSDDVLQLPADGKTKTEILIDYGSQYEHVRVRKGYSRLPPDKYLEKIQQLEREDADYVREISTFSCNELNDAKEFFSKVFKNKNAFVRDEARERALCVAIVLKARAKSILDEFRDLDVNSESFCDNGVTSLDLTALVEAFGDLVLVVCKQWDDPAAIKESLLKKDLLVDVLKEIWHLDDLVALKPTEFYEKIIGEY